jgi:hypothetical protein
MAPAAINQIQSKNKARTSEETADRTINNNLATERQRAALKPAAPSTHTQKTASKETRSLATQHEQQRGRWTDAQEAGEEEPTKGPDVHLAKEERCSSEHARCCTGAGSAPLPQHTTSTCTPKHEQKPQAAEQKKERHQ